MWPNNNPSNGSKPLVYSEENTSLHPGLIGKGKKRCGTVEEMSSLSINHKINYFNVRKIYIAPSKHLWGRIIRRAWVIKFKHNMSGCRKKNKMRESVFVGAAMSACVYPLTIVLILQGLAQVNTRLMYFLLPAAARCSLQILLSDRILQLNSLVMISCFW